jgi:rhodanese-related sulfurtransferase
MKSELIELEKFKEYFESGEFELIDVRKEEEYTQGHIKNAKVVDVSSDDFSEEISKFDRDKKYLLYCRTDNRTRNAMFLMEMLGFKEVYGLLGGFNTWVENELEFEK